MGIKPLNYQIAPVSATEGGFRPALILLHGRGTDETDLLDLAPYFDSRFLIASVRAPYQFSYGGFTWFDAGPSGTINIDQLLESQGALLQWIDTFQKSYDVDPLRIFLFGFSMGAMMALSTSLTRPEYFKGIVAHSGLLPTHARLPYHWKKLHAVSFFIAHGVDDPIVPVTFGREAHKKFIEMDANVEYHEYPIQHAISEESLTDIARWIHKQL